MTAWGPFETAIHAACVKDRGIPGDRTHWLLGRMKEITDRTPRELFLMTGVNDLMAGETPAQIADDYRAVVDYVHRESPATAVYVESVLPTKHGEWPVAELDDRLRVLAAAEHATYVDVAARFGANGAPAAGLERPDGVHLTPAGYAAWISVVSPLVEH